MALPDGFRWQSIYGISSGRDRDALAYKGREVARMCERVGGGWLALLRYPDGRDVHRPCSSYESGKAGIIVWAKRHETELVDRCEAKEQAWRARKGQPATQHPGKLSTSGVPMHDVKR